MCIYAPQTNICVYMYVLYEAILIYSDSERIFVLKTVSHFHVNVEKKKSKALDLSARHLKAPTSKKQPW